MKVQNSTSESSDPLEIQTYMFTAFEFFGDQNIYRNTGFSFSAILRFLTFFPNCAEANKKVQKL